MDQEREAELPVCSPWPPLKDRRLIGQAETSELAGLFKVLASDTRLRLLHALAKSGRLCVTELAEAVGMKPQAVSNQLQRLLDRGILKATRHRNNIQYRIVDPCVLSLLELALCPIQEAERRT